jgi:small subunit ribosomal protein S2
MSVVTMKELLESGVHFGHQTYKWNPKMDKYIFIKRNGIHILDLKQTLDAINEAYMFIKDVSLQGGTVLFVGTKKQAKDAIEAAAKKSDSYYVNNRWYGGMLTNLQTIRKSIEKLDNYEKLIEDGTINSFTKLEATKMKKKYEKTLKALAGIRDMEELPSALFVVDILKEEIAIKEARKLHIPIVAMVDTNCDPDLVDYVIPANDDAIRAISLISNIMANAIIEGRQSLLEGKDLKKETSEETTEETNTEENKEENQ